LARKDIDGGFNDLLVNALMNIISLLVRRVGYHLWFIDGEYFVY